MNLSVLFSNLAKLPPDADEALEMIRLQPDFIQAAFKNNHIEVIQQEINKELYLANEITVTHY